MYEYYAVGFAYIHDAVVLTLLNRKCSPHNSATFIALRKVNGSVDFLLSML